MRFICVSLIELWLTELHVGELTTGPESVSGHPPDQQMCDCESTVK